ncbi:MAG: type IX secretion system membrane protein PorP/SprF, partial [Bacteroidia bacterium]
MKLKTTLLLAICCCILQNHIFAQNTNIHQWQANYAYTNPAFTGISINPRLHGSYQQIFPNFLKDLRIYELSYDQRISPKAGFIGVSLVQDVTSQIATRQVAGLQYAYEFKLSDEIKLRTAASLS